MKVETKIAPVVNTVEQTLKKELQQISVKHDGSVVTYMGYAITNREV